MKILKNYFYAKLLAFKRRICIFLFGKFDPYPSISKSFSLNPSDFIHYDYKNIETKNDLKKKDFDINLWKKKSKVKMRELLNIKNDLDFSLKHQISMPIKTNFYRKRIYIEFSKFRHAPIDIIKKQNIDSYKGIIVCIQGDNSGAHLNLGEIKFPADVTKVANGSDLAIQAAERDFIAVSFERMGFGERREQKLIKPNADPIIDTSLHSLMIGRTLLGETVKEVKLVINWLKNKYKNKKVWLVGYSSAGTTALAAASIYNSIDGIAVGGCVGLSNETLLTRGSGGYTSIPGILKWIDLDGQIGLISPRPCIIIAGKNDHIWPYKKALNVVRKSKKIYRHDSAENNLKLIKASGGHTYYPNLMWPEILRYFSKN